LEDPGDDPSSEAAPIVAGFDGRFSSPSIVRVGDAYHAYFAQQDIHGRHYNTPHAIFEHGHWSFVGEALHRLNRHADDTGNYPVWAPGVARIDADHWMLYYTARLRGTAEKKCLFRAHSPSPHGPFIDDYDDPLYCAPDTLWTIDAYPVEDIHGDWHLAARIDQPGGINTIQLRALARKGEHFAADSHWIELTHNRPGSWEQPVMENAGVVHLAPRSGRAHWFVFYSAGAWYDNRYSIGYADCGPRLSDGHCVKRTVDGPWLQTNHETGTFGPGTPTFYTNTDGDTMMSVQAWEHSGGTSNPNNHGQIMRTYRIHVDDDYVPHRTLVRIDR
jgi:hypothetical protein